jgi:hypothetical protein
MSDFLTSDEINIITQESKNPIYKDSSILTIGRKKTDIVRISPIHNLIFINGNEKTGLTHINQRHLQFQEVPKWKKQKDQNGLEGFILDKPSFFHSSIIPIFDYPKIADAIFDKKNINTKDNRTPAYVDLYSGDYYPKNYDPAPYRLLLYKGTKIVHNLYPITNQFSPIRILNYKRGQTRAELHIQSCTAIIEIPYYDQNKTIRYQIIFQRDDFKKTEKVFIKRFHADGSPFQIFYVAQRELNNTFVDQTVLWAYEFSEFTYFERVIHEIDSH